MFFCRSLLRSTRLWQRGRDFNTDALSTSGHSTPGLGSYFLLLPSIVAGTLGVWQLKRSSWKANLIECREKRLLGQQVDLLDPSVSPLEYTPTKVCGTFINEASVFVGPRVRSVHGIPEKGYILVTPLKSSLWGRTVLVNRGWVPESWRNEKCVPADDTLEVEVQGILAKSEVPSSFTPANDPATKTWFSIDTAAIAAACGLSTETPMLQVVQYGEDPEYRMGRTAIEVLGGRTTRIPAEVKYPIPKDFEELLQFSVMPGTHLMYSGIWFSLSISTAYMAAKALRKGRMPRPAM